MPFFDTLQAATAQEREALFGVPVIRPTSVVYPLYANMFRDLPRARARQDEVHRAPA